MFFVCIFPTVVLYKLKNGLYPSVILLGLTLVKALSHYKNVIRGVLFTPYIK